MPPKKQKKAPAQVRAVVIAKPKKKSKATKRSAFGSALVGGGAAISSLLGLGPSVGRAIGSGVSRIFGQGDYMFNKPQQNSLMTGGPPSFSPLTKGFRVCHREYVRDITSSTSFSSTTYSLNPGLNTLFPWLSSAAQLFEEYKIHGMIVYLNSTSGSSVGTTNTALGLWGVVTQYDPAEPDFTTKQQCENYVGCQTSTPSQSLAHGIECKPKSNVLDRMYVRTGDAGAEDLKFYDWGKIQIFTQGMQAPSTIGEMWVSYDIEFFKPRLPTGGYIDFTDRYALTGATSTAPLTGLKGIYPNTGSNIGTYLNPSAAQPRTIVWPAGAPLGYYMVTAYWTLTSLSSLAQPTVTATGAMVFPATNNVFSTGNLIQAPLPNEATATACSLTFVVQKRDAGIGTVDFSTATLPGSPRLDLTITRVHLPNLSEKPNRTKLSLDELGQVRQLLSLLGTTSITDLVAKLQGEQSNPPSKEEEIAPAVSGISMDVVD